MPYLASGGGINLVAPVKCRVVQTTSDLSQNLLIQSPSRLDTALHDQATSVSLSHRVIHASRVTCAETREHLLRRWSIVRLAHPTRFPLAGTKELHRGTPKGVTEEGEG